jgi:hypothetical protein
MELAAGRMTFRYAATMTALSGLAALALFGDPLLVGLVWLVAMLAVSAVGWEAAHR